MTYQDIRAMWKGFSIDSVAKLEQRLDSFRVLFAYHSGRIENEEITYHDTRDIFEHGKVTGFTGNPRALLESQNQKLCYEYLKDRIIRRAPLSVELLLETHRILAAGTYDERRYIEQDERAGAFKKHDYIVGIHEVGSPPADVERDLSDLLDEVNAYRGKRSLTAAAYFHARFESIHPFADGNGRVGRALLNYFLMIRDEPPLIIYEDDRKEYYAALEAYDRDEDLKPMAAFLERETLRTWEKAWGRTQDDARKGHKHLDECLDSK